MYVCYLITNGPYTYVGITNNLPHRLRQHNGELAGGARSTTRRAIPGVAWRVAALVTNIEHKNDALSFEKRVHMRRRRGLTSALQTMEAVLAQFKSGQVVNKDTQIVRDASLWELQKYS